MTRIPSTEEAQRAAFAAILVTPTQTTASNMGRGQITVIASTDARNPALPVPPATMNMQTIPIPMASGQAPAKPSISARKPARFVRLAVKNAQTTPIQTAMESATIAARPSA